VLVRCIRASRTRINPSNFCEDLSRDGAGDSNVRVLCKSASAQDQLKELTKVSLKEWGWNVVSSRRFALRRVQRNATGTLPRVPAEQNRPLVIRSKDRSGSKLEGRFGPIRPLVLDGAVEGSAEGRKLVDHVQRGGSPHVAAKRKPKRNHKKPRPNKKRGRSGTELNAMRLATFNTNGCQGSKPMELGEKCRELGTGIVGVTETDGSNT